MLNTFRRICAFDNLVAFAFSSVLLLMLAAPARGVTVFNGSFEDTGGATASFSINNPTALPNWTATPSGSHVLDCLMFAGDTTNLCGTVAFGGGFTFWVNPGPSPDGGNFVGIDGDSNFATPLTQLITGLVIGMQYDVTFYQASGQQNGFNGDTTERWQVTLGTESQLSTLMTTPNHSSVGWMSQTLTFTATAVNETLSFLAVGTPNGLPPFVLLDGVSMTESTPEPVSYALVGLGLAGILVARRRKAKRG